MTNLSIISYHRFSHSINTILKIVLKNKYIRYLLIFIYLFQAAAEPEEEVQAAVKTMFNVKLVKFDAAKKVALIKEIKTNVEGMNLVQVRGIPVSCYKRLTD